MTKEERESLEKRAHEMSAIGFAEALDDAIRRRRALDVAGGLSEQDPFAPVMAKYEALLDVTGKVNDRLDEAVRLLERWAETCPPRPDRARPGNVDIATVAFLTKVRP